VAEAEGQRKEQALVEGHPVSATQRLLALLYYICVGFINDPQTEGHTDTALN
jgi:hypothetical protein